MKVTTDPGKCIAAGNCVLVAASVFDQHEEDGTVVLLHHDPPAEAADDVRQAVNMCPAQAIRIED